MQNFFPSNPRPEVIRDSNTTMITEPKEPNEQEEGDEPILDGAAAADVPSEEELEGTGALVD